MRHTLYLIILCLGLVEAQAQKLSKSYTEASLSDVLIDLNRSQTDSRISFIYDELEDFTVTTSLRNQTIGDAVRQVVGFYPMKITETDSLITVECVQKETQKVIGRVINEQGLPVEFANVALLLPADSSFINGGVTNANGDFVIPCRPGRMLIRVSFVGYKTHYQPCTVGEVGNIRLRRDAIVLKNVVVKGEIPQFQMTAGGMTVNVQGTLLAKMGTATDLLGQLPRVTASPEGNVSVYGKGTPIIYINNRKVRDNRELTQLKSEDIKSVDIITSPGAKYDAAAESVILIRTLRRRGEGFSLKTETNIYNNTHWRGYEDLTAKYSTDRLEVSLNGYYRHGWMGEDNHFGQDLYGQDATTSVRQNLLTRYRHDMLYGEASLSFDINDSTSLGLTYDVWKTFNAKVFGEGPQEIYRNNQLVGTLLQQQNVGTTDGPDHDLTQV